MLDSQDFLTGGGEMTQLIRSIDWAKTPIGPIDRWPSSLKTTVGLCLNSPNPILIWWSQDLVVIYNDACRAILGSNHPNALGVHNEATWPEIWAIIEPLLHRVLSDGQPARAENLVLNHNGYAEEYTFSFSPVRDESGSINGAFTIVAKTTDKTSNPLNDPAKPIVEFFNHISHEFRTPLTLLLGPLEEIQAESSSFSKSLQEHINVSHRSALRLLKLVNNLLDFSRLEAGRMDAHFVPTDLATLTANLTGNFRSTIEKAGINLVVRCIAPEEPIYVDRDMWEKIVLNLLSNAFKYTKQGTIEVSLQSSGQTVDLVVTDTGIGIRPEELPKIFERFYKGDQAAGRAREGTGIGLALVRELVNLHGGTLRVESDYGLGSSFTVSLPAGRAHMADRQLHRSPATVSQHNVKAYIEEAIGWLPAADQGKIADDLAGGEISPQPADKKSILVIDDNADMRHYLARVLRPHYEVAIACNGQEAWDIIHENPPQLVISDIMMPVMDGFELLDKIRSNGRIAALPVILLSARAGEEATMEGLEKGADDYLVKPFSTRDLLSRVATLFQLTEIRRLGQVEFRNLIVQSPVPIAVLKGRDMVVSIANNSILAIWGKGNDALNEPLLEITPELKDQGFPELLDRVYTTGLPYIGQEMKVRLQRDGLKEECYFNFVCQPLREANGLVSGVTIIANEVTEQVKAKQP